jgi:ABC-2 type transport system permease protein
VTVLQATVALGARGVLAYRTGVAVRFVSAALVALLTWAVWTAVTDGRDQVAGVPATVLVTYVVVAWLSASAWTSPVAAELAQRFRSGDLALTLLRPVRLQTWLYQRDVGRAGATFVLTAVPLLAVSLVVLPLHRPESGVRWLLFFVSLVLAHAVAFGLAWLVGLGAVLLRTGRGLLHLQGAAFALLSGALIPLDLYPQPVTALARALPFAALADGPASIFVGRAGVEVVVAQAGWAVGLGLLGALAWRGVRRRIVVQGG